MARRPDLSCAGCGKLMWRGSTSLPEGQARCNPCRGSARKNKTATEHHVCRACGIEWQRQPTKGRVPKFCPECRPTAAQFRRYESVRCVACREPVKRMGAYYCSKSCSAKHCDTARWPKCAVPLDHPSRRNYPERGPSVRVFIPDCVMCGRTFATRYTIKTCSEICKQAKHKADRNETKHRRRARKRGAFVAAVSPRKIHQRDGWRCHLCGKLVSRTAVVPHPRAATIDHLVPLAAGGMHEPANVATAHFICNALKGDRGGGEQLALIG